jgi:RNA-directed DNA polymerase
MADQALLRALANSFLGGEAAVEQIIARGTRTLGRPWRWLRPLAQRYLKSFQGRQPRHRDVVHFLSHDKGFTHVRSKYRAELSVAEWLTDPPQMRPVSAAESWNLPAIGTPGALADWLGLSPGELRWFADLRGLAYKNNHSLLSHYHYRILAKQSGNIRLIEVPKPRLKALQRQILTQILERIPLHPAVHGFVKGRSIKTFSAPHVGRRVILKMDLQEFFPSFSGARIQSFFRTLGYPEAVADLLGGICTNATTRNAWKEAAPVAAATRVRAAQSLYARPHLPQGAATSPALANLCAYRVDSRLEGLAKAAGAEYTRYADDLAFSSDEREFERRIERFSTHVAATLMEEGFTVHHRKTRVMRQGVRQYLAGLVTNAHPNVIRADFDRLKAMLTNCLRHGPESQNRDAHPNFRAHLEGRVGFVEMINPARGKRLRAMLKQIQWS